MRLGSLLVALSLLGGADGLAQDAGHKRPVPRNFTIPQIIDTVDVEGEQKAMGVPLTLKAVRTRMHIDDVKHHVMKQWHDAGLYIPDPHHITQTTPEQILVALDPFTLVSYSAIFQPNPDKTTTVILGTSFLDRRESQALPAWGPIYPGATDVMTTESEGVQTATYLVGVPDAEARNFHDTVLKGAGFEKKPGDAYLRGAERLTVTYTPQPKGKLRVLIVRQLGAAD